MANHPPELDRSRYRCCCYHVHESVLIIAILGLIFESVYNPISLIAHVLLLVGYATKNHRLYHFYVVLAIISCVFLVLAALGCVVIMVASSLNESQWRGYFEETFGWSRPDPQPVILVFVFLFLLALVVQIWFIHVVRRAMDFLDEKEKLEKAKKERSVATPNVFVAQQPIASDPASTSAQPPYATGYAQSASAPQPGPSAPYPAHDASYPTKNPGVYPRV